ncbi:MAG: PQQ-binding-like beta-propeller repeat protein, partial [Planctomycetota bacterium]
PISYHAGNRQYDGPHSTPCFDASCLIKISIDAHLDAIDLETGNVRWSRDLRKDFGTQLPQSGYAASPLIHDGVVIVPTLGIAQPTETEFFDNAEVSKRTRGRSATPGAVALNLESGRMEWRTESFRSSHASPNIATIDGQTTVLFHGMFELIGVNPSDGSILWRHLLRPVAADNVAFMPLWDRHNHRVLISHGYCDRGTQAITVGRQDGRWKTDLSWSNRDLRLVHSNAVVAGTTLVGVNDVGGTVSVGLNIRDGRTIFKKRSSPRNFLCGQESDVLSLGHSGKMSNQTVSQDGLQNRWTFQALNSTSWTVPSLVGDRLLLRDNAALRVYQQVD